MRTIPLRNIGVRRMERRWGCYRGKRRCYTPERTPPKIQRNYKSKIAYMIYGRLDSRAMQITCVGRISGPGQTPNLTVPSANPPCHQGQLWCYTVDFFWQELSLSDLCCHEHKTVEGNLNISEHFFFCRVKEQKPNAFWEQTSLYKTEKTKIQVRSTITGNSVQWAAFLPSGLGVLPSGNGVRRRLFWMRIFLICSASPTHCWRPAVKLVY